MSWRILIKISDAKQIKPKKKPVLIATFLFELYFNISLFMLGYSKLGTWYFHVTSGCGGSPHHKARDRDSPGETPPCSLMTLSACKVCFGCNVLHVPPQIIPLRITYRRSHLFRDGSKLRWHVSESSSGMNLRPSTIAHCVVLVWR